MTADQASPSDQLIHQIMDGLDNLVWSMALPELTPLYFNQSFATNYNCQVSELLENRERWLEGIVLEDRSIVFEALAIAKSQGVAQVSYRICHGFNQKDCCLGTKFSWVSTRFKTIHDAQGQPIRIDAIATPLITHGCARTILPSRNQTSNRTSYVEKFDHNWGEELSTLVRNLIKAEVEHQKTSDALTSKGDLYRRVIQYQQDLILHSHPDTTITFANSAVCKMLGCEMEDIIGKKWIDFANSEDLQSTLAKLTALNPLSPSFITENRDYRANSQEGWTQWINLGIFDEAGNLIEIHSIGRDITAIKKLNQELEAKVEERTLALQKLEKRYLSIIKSLPDLLLLLKADGTCLECILPTAYESLYLPIKHHISEVLGDSTLQEQLALYAKALATGESQIYEHQLLKFGKTVYEEVRITPCGEDEVLVIVRDISNRKLAEERLLKSETHLKNAQRIGKIGSWEYNIEADTAIWSEEVFRIFGRDMELGTPNFAELQRLIHPDDWERFQLTVKTAIATAQPYDIEYRICAADGSIVYVLVRGEIICDHRQKPLRIIGTVIDLTHRKLAEMELNRNRDLREAIFNESADALFLVDSVTLLTTDCNKRATELFEASKSQLIGIEGHILQKRQFTDQELAEIRQTMENTGEWNMELEYVTLKGKVFWGNLAARVIEVAGKQINLVRVTDISNRKMIEAQILQTSHQLQLINRELETFCYSVSHDLRAPLRHMNGFVNALEQQLQKYDLLKEPKIGHYLQVIANSSQKMGLLIDGLLTLSRYGRRPLDLQELSVRELVNEAIEIISADQKSSHDVDFVIGELPQVIGDRVLLQQVFRNLIGNAVKFSQNQPSPQITITSLPNLTVVIADNGVGFSMEYADKLFGAFQRLHNEKEFEGTGIGLAIVQRIMQRHHGHVWAESAPNQGARFFLQFNSS
ncbi:MAG: PAS domain S-box protein [Pseudanabaenaceae cyanobacterium bins.39]|nr:PAS domain S-box protein [Pseudanabaenaceae cyanobacterium bins.39]